jgi:peptide chain release factor 1
VDKTLLFSLSKDQKDFIVQAFKGSGKGGQKRNKTMSACRIIHPASGAVSECQEERSFEQNKKRAFSRLIEKPKFKAWLDIEKARAIGMLHDVEQSVEEQMRDANIRVEVKDENGNWVEKKID